MKKMRQSLQCPYIESHSIQDSRNDWVFLAQCDTTAGFLSRNPQKLNRIKSRPLHQKVLIEVVSLESLKFLVRVPIKHKNRVRRAKYTTFIYPNTKAIRLVQDERHLRFLKFHKMLYSTSANPTNESFNEQWAKSHCDVIVLDKQGFAQKPASKVYRINDSKIQRRR